MVYYHSNVNKRTCYNRVDTLPNSGDFPTIASIAKFDAASFLDVSDYLVLINIKFSSALRYCNALLLWS